MFPLAAKNCRLMRYIPDNLPLQTRFTMSSLWSSIFLKIFFPGNVIWKIWHGMVSDQVKILARARGGMDETTSCGRVEQKLIVEDTHAYPVPLPGIEYVDIE